MNNEDKILKLLESMDERMSGMENGLSSTDNRMAGMDKRMSGIETGIGNLQTLVDRIDASQVRMETEITEKVRALFDSREVQNDINEQIVTTLDRIEAKVDVLQLETAHLRRVK